MSGAQEGSMLEGVSVGPSYEYRAGRVVSLAEKLAGRRLSGLDLYLAGDLYYLFYLPFPRLVAEPSESAGPRWVTLAAILADSRTWKIKAYTVADPALSMVAATVLAVTLARGSRGSSGDGARRSDNSGGERGSRTAVSRGLSEALEAVRNAAAAKSIIEKMGAGHSSSLIFEDTLDIILELSRKSNIREIERILSGIEISRVSSPREAPSPRGWVTGIEIGGDLERVHPSRLALPEDLFYAELANSRLLLYRKHLNADKGDVYVLLDKSGSMSGEKMNWARAVAIALLIKARTQGRKFRLRYFDSIVYDIIEVKGRPRPRQLAEALKRIATVKASGGTNITGAIARAVDDLSESRGRSDIVLITDGEDKLSVHILKSILSRPGLRLHTVMIKGENPALEKVSASYMVAVRLDSGEGLKVVRKAISEARV